MPPQPNHRTRVRLLLVEDDPDHAWLLTDQLRMGGFELKTLRVEKAEAMRVALRDPWDAIIADNRLLNFSGMNALAIYRETGLDIPFLVVAVGEAAGNAIKHGELGLARVRKDKNRLQIEVTDRGPGIRAEDLPASILQTGFSTKRSLGMGYSLMLELVDQIWLASQPGGTSLQLEKGILSPPDPLIALLDRYD